MEMEIKALVFSGVLLLLLLMLALNSNDGSVLLRDIQALTLHKNWYTTARRSSPIPQLKCVGGTAGCQAFVPEEVQCVNRGWDGVDVQWECKTHMDKSYRFGHIEVSCEGYSHPADPYILKGSCGLEYTLELTEEGLRRAQDSGGSHSEFGGLLVFVFFFLVIGTCIYFCNGDTSKCGLKELIHLLKLTAEIVSSVGDILSSLSKLNNAAASPGTRIASGFGGTIRR